MVGRDNRVFPAASLNVGAFVPQNRVVRAGASGLSIAEFYSHLLPDTLTVNNIIV